MNGIVTTYLYSYGNSNNYTSFSKDQLKFIESTKSIFSDFLVLEQKIASGKYREREIPILAKLLKYKRKFDKSEKILFNSSWDEVDNPNESEYYANINSIKDSVFHLSYFFKDGTPVYEGHYTSFYPHLKNGEFIWYYPNGVIRKKATYINNTPQSINTFYKNGQIHHYYKLYKKEIKLAQVYSENGDSLLNSQGNGFESFFDSIGKREITNEFVNRELAKSYYFDSNKRKISLFCDKFAKIKNLKNFQTNIDEINTYPINSVQKFNHGIALVKFIIEKDGTVSDFKIIKSVDQDCDDVINSLFKEMKKEKGWKPAKDFGQNIVQEIVVPIDFSILGFSRYRNNNNNAFMINQMMMMQQQRMMMNQINMAPRF